MNVAESIGQVDSIDPIAFSQLRSRGDRGDLIDVRSPVEFEAVHAEGARLVPLDKLDVKAVLAARAAPDEPMYLICKSGERAEKARGKFIAAGFSNAICIEGGTDAWIRAGLPVVRGRKTISLERQV